jgi:hypothetical protein
MKSAMRKMTQLGKRRTKAINNVCKKAIANPRWLLEQIAYLNLLSRTLENALTRKKKQKVHLGDFFSKVVRPVRKRSLRY